MRELHGVISAKVDFSITSLKRQSLLFDKWQVLDLDAWLRKDTTEKDKNLHRDVEYLQEKGYINSALADICNGDDITPDSLRLIFSIFGAAVESIALEIPKKGIPASPKEVMPYLQDAAIRVGAAEMNFDSVDCVPVCRQSLMGATSATTLGKYGKPSVYETVLCVALDKLPVPSPRTSWDDILAFKEEVHKKQWGFRRWLAAMSEKLKTESEIKDEFAWMMDEYETSMKIHHIKSSNGIVETYIIPTMEVTEDLAKFNWSKIAKGAVSVKKRKVELLETERNLNGKECAYVFEAQERFKSS